MNFRKLSITFILFIFQQFAVSQPITMGNLGVVLNPKGGGGNELPAMLFPASSNGPIVKHSGLWLSANSQVDSFVSAVFINPQQSDFGFGPVVQPPNILSDTSVWNSVFVMQQDWIDQHKRNTTGNSHAAIFQWPANAPPSAEGPLAPFIDWNNNFLYEPALGEYPVIEGEKAVLSIFNDISSQHNASFSEPMGVEVKQFDYVKSDNNTLLTRVLIKNTTSNTLNNFKMGVYAELMLGEGNTNFMRSLPHLNAVAVYPANLQQNDSFFGKSAPAYALVLLNRPNQATMYVDISQDVVTGIPTSAAQVTNYLSAKWRNGKRLTYGSNGVDGSANARFVFPAEHDPLNQDFEWTEENSGRIPGKRGVLLVADSLDILPSQTIELRYAQILIPSYNHAFYMIENEINAIQTAYQKGELTSVMKSQPLPAFSVFPNPSFANQQLKLKLLQNASVKDIEIIDYLGRKHAIQFDNQTPTRIVINHNLTPGSYKLKLIYENGTVFKNIVIL